MSHPTQDDQSGRSLAKGRKTSDAAKGKAAPSKGGRQRSEGPSQESGRHRDGHARSMAAPSSRMPKLSDSVRSAIMARLAQAAQAMAARRPLARA